MKLSEAEELLPWAIAGTLSEDEARAVQAFIDSGEISPEAVEELRFLSDSVKTVAAEEPKYNPAILKNVMSQLDEVPQAENIMPMQQRAQVKTEKVSLFEKIGEFLQWSLTPAWAKVTITAQLALIVGAIAVFTTNNDGTTGGTEFQTASGDGVGDFSVGFNPGSTETDIRALLQQHNLIIVDGPSALGLYTLDAADGADVNALQSQLTDSSLINFVQPVEEP